MTEGRPCSRQEMKWVTGRSSRSWQRVAGWGPHGLVATGRREIVFGGRCRRQ